MKTTRIEISQRSRQWISLTGILVLAVGLKIVLLLLDRFPFNSDEAVVALMARHILSGERPIFFYGQAYMGSLDAWLVAIGFAAFVQQVWVIRLVQTLLYLFTIITTVWIGKEFLRSPKIGLGAGLLLAAPTVNVTLYTTVSLGGYGEALLIGNFILICALKIARISSEGGQLAGKAGLFLGFGLLAGLGLWANGLTLIYTIPAALLILFCLQRKHSLKNNLRYIGLGIAGLLLGSLAWWWYAVDAGFGSLINELFGSAVAVEGGSWIVRIWQHLVNLLLLGVTVTLGFRPPWDVTWLALPLIPIALFIWVIVFIYWKRLISKGEESIRMAYWLLAGVCLTLAAGFIFTSFGVDPSGRYFVPLAIPFSLVASAAFHQFVNRKIWMYAGFVVLLAFHLWGTIQSALRYPPGITTQFYSPAQVDHRRMDELIDFLSNNGITRGYTNYWVSYPLAFSTQEEIIFTPRLPYHTDLRYTARDDRYPPYQQLVAESEQVAYITTKNPALDEFLIEGMQAARISWQENWIGDYHIFFNLSQPIRPEELGLGDEEQ